MASIRERGEGVWQVRVSTGRRDRGGRWVYVTRTVHGDRRAAQRAASQLQAARGGRTTMGTDPDLGDLIEEWLGHLELRGRSPMTIRGYRQKLTYLPQAMADTRVSALTSRALDRLYSDLSRRGLAPASVRQLHAIIRAALNQAMRWDIVDRNVAAQASPPELDQREQTPPSPELVLRAVDEATAILPAFGAWLLLAASTGARRAELCGLQWSDLDVAAGTVRIERTVQVIGSKDDTRWLTLPTKTRSSRVVALDPAMLAALAEHRARVDAMAADAGMLVPADGWMWSDEPDGAVPWRPDRVTHAWHRLRVAMPELAGVRLHDLRHFHVTHLLAAGLDVTAVAGRVGHRDSTTTQKIYAHALKARDTAAAEAIGRVLGR